MTSQIPASDSTSAPNENSFIHQDEIVSRLVQSMMCRPQKRSNARHQSVRTAAISPTCGSIQKVALSAPSNSALHIGRPAPRQASGGASSTSLSPVSPPSPAQPASATWRASASETGVSGWPVS
jgi:hypothetical protein